MDGGGGKSSHRRSLQQLPRTGSDQQHPRGANCSPVRMDPDVNLQDEKQHRKSTTRRSAQVSHFAREIHDGWWICFLTDCLRSGDELEGPPASFKPLYPAKPSPSFLELPSTQWRPSAGLPYTQAARIGKGKRHFSPEHRPQECFGLLECMHNNIQVQTQIAQAQLSLLEDMRETMNVLLSRQERQSQESAGQSEQRTQKGAVSSPRPLS